jgi:hypothetical protein
MVISEYQHFHTFNSIKSYFAFIWPYILLVEETCISSCFLQIYVLLQTPIFCV